MILLSFYGESIIDLKSLPALDIISVLATFFLMVSVSNQFIIRFLYYQDIVMDNWIINLTNSKDTYSLATICQNMGSLPYPPANK